MDQKKTILLVEDIESNIDVISKQLECLGYRVTVARNGLEALAQLDRQIPDLIIMDIQLPKMGGFEAVSRIRTNSDLRDLPILAATAKSSNADRARCLAVGCDAYIAKPFTHVELKTAIDDLFRRQEKYAVPVQHP